MVAYPDREEDVDPSCIGLVHVGVHRTSAASRASFAPPTAGLHPCAASGDRWRLGIGPRLPLVVVELHGAAVRPPLCARRSSNLQAAPVCRTALAFATPRRRVRFVWPPLCLRLDRRSSPVDAAVAPLGGVASSGDPALLPPSTPPSSPSSLSSVQRCSFPLLSTSKAYSTNMYFLLPEVVVLKFATSRTPRTTCA